MQKFDFDKVELIMKAGKLKRELSPGLDIASLYVAGYEDAVQACSEHYEEQIKQKLAAIDAEIKESKEEVNKTKSSYDVGFYDGLRKARGIIAGEGEWWTENRG
jgi:hypothetical protein